MNCALHMIAVTQARGIGPGRDYHDGEGETTGGGVKAAALRAAGLGALPQPVTIAAARTAARIVFFVSN